MAGISHKQLIANIVSGQIEKTYILHGEEPYFIDAIAEALIEHALPEQDKAFDQVILYGKDAEPLSLLSELKNYPMLAQRKLVVLKEAQDMKTLEQLAPYFEQISDRTIFVICHKYKTIDSRKKMLKDAQKTGTVFKSEKVRDYQLVEWISNYVKGRGMQISSKAALLLAEFLGNDLGKIVNEINKLEIVLGKKASINDEHIELHIGISKDYNVYELNNALALKDSVKAMKIVDYFRQNPKQSDVIAMISSAFRLYSQLMRIQFSKVKSQEHIAGILKVHPFAAGELIKQARNFDAKKLATNIGILHEYDLRSKGIGTSSMVNKSDLMFEMVYRLLND
jgi:DNA polymerase-3 subunit delta